MTQMLESLQERSVLFQAYVKANKLYEGDLYKPLDYRRWLALQNETFDRACGLSPMMPYTDIQYEQFIEFCQKNPAREEGWMDDEQKISMD